MKLLFSDTYASDIGKLKGGFSIKRSLAASFEHLKTLKYPFASNVLPLKDDCDKINIYFCDAAAILL